MEDVELEALLSRDLDDLRVWETQEFDRQSHGRQLVLMGAGGLGARALAGLRRHGIEPLAFADNGLSRQGTTLNGIPVLAPETAAREFGSTAAFVVTIWGANKPHRYAHSQEQLKALGCDVVCSFPALFWKFQASLLPFYLQDLPSQVLAARTEVRRALDLWEDHASRVEYVAQVRFRLAADFDGLPHPVKHPQYFPDDLYAWRGDEWMVDGGAYDGDTIRTVARLHGGRFERVLAVEPDPANFARLVETVGELPAWIREKVECRHMALATTQTTLYLDATGTASSATSADASVGTVAVKAEPLDALLRDVRPTLIKLDIEGFEPDALKGAQQVIERDAPVLAICVYHRQDHLWSIPLMLREWRDDYAFFLRPHNEEGWDLVCYAIPRARLIWNDR